MRNADKGDRRPVFGDQEFFQSDPHWCDYLLFYEYFNGGNGAGMGASHQTGWTALVLIYFKIPAVSFEEAEVATIV